MARNSSDAVETAILAQLVREYELPTHPTPFMVSDVVSNVVQAPPTTSRGIFELEEEDKKAILAALDGNCELSQSPPFFEHDTSKPVANSRVQDKELKLALQRAKATKRRNRHRQRVKEEWQTLRLQDTQLSAKLKALIRARTNGCAGVNQLKWQVLASKELDARLQAEGQQQRIRMAIERRAVVMQKLQDVLDTLQPVKSDNVVPEWNADDFKLYESFSFDLAAAYSRTDSVLHECGLTGALPSHTSFYKPIRRRDAVRDVAFFESTSAFVMRSKYPAPANAMFDAMRQIHRQHPRRAVFETEDNLRDTIAVKFGMINHCEEGQVVHLAMIIVLNRFTESDRTVLVWRCLVHGEGEFTGAVLDETGWCVLRPASSGSLESTDVRTCVYSAPVHPSANKAVVEERDEVFANAVISSSQEDSVKLAHLMDQLLLNA